MPIMGMARKRTAIEPGGLAAALFSRTQQAVLGLLFGQPERSFYATELIARLGAGSGAVQRELAKLENSELVLVRRIGAQKHYQANPSSPLFSELCSIAQKTTGLAGPVMAALDPIAGEIAAAFVYGSVSKGSDTATSDIDLMVLSDHVSYAEVFGAIEPLHEILGRKVNPTVYSREEWKRRLKENNAFVTRVLAQPKVWVIGGDDDLRA